ncbi:MAG: N-6 DNA methylase [Armatimonadetes bacterium]|nr:N-6 DNA methylase [Armatimonadota bacterium]
MSPSELLAAAQVCYDQRTDLPAAPRLLAAGLSLVLGDGDPRLLAGITDTDVWPAEARCEPAEAAEALAGVSVEDGRLTRHRGGRRGLGAYYTPPWLVERLVSLVAPASWPVHSRAGPQSTALAAGATRGAALDPACGAGAFLVELLRRGVNDVWGVDGDPLAVLAARRALCAAGLSAAQAVERVSLGDGLLDTRWHGRFDLVIGNPPWGLAFDRACRARLASAGLLDPGEPSSEAAFLRAAHRQVRDGGRVGFVLPESWLSTRRGRSLRRWLLTSNALDHVEVYRKGVFAGARDMVPVLLALRRAEPAARATVGWHGLARPLDTDPTSLAQRTVDPRVWLDEPDTVFVLGQDEGLGCHHPRLDDVASLHDGFYKSHLVADPAGQPMLTAARGVRPFWLAPTGELVRVALDGLPPGELARQRRPKLLVHAMRKPALPQRIVAAADLAGEYLASNNLLMVIPRDDCPWSLDALAALLNSGPLNRWYAARFIQVNVEAFTLGAVPLPAWSAEADAALVAVARSLDSLPARGEGWGGGSPALDALVLGLYGA